LKTSKHLILHLQFTSSSQFWHHQNITKHTLNQNNTIHPSEVR